MLLQLQDIHKNFGGLRVLQGIDLTLDAGQIRSIIGPNGCGKTTLFNIITGAFEPSAGRVLFRGADITGRAPHRIARLGVARKFQVPGIYASLTVGENLEAARLGLRGAARGALTDRALQSLLERFGLAREMTRPAGTLAHGKKQWLEIAMLLCMNATLLLLDEPTAGMSAAETAATAQLVSDVAREHGTAVLVIEHDMNFVKVLGSPVVVTLRGRVVFEGCYEAARAHEEVRAAYLGSA